MVRGAVSLVAVGLVAWVSAAAAGVPSYEDLARRLVGADQGVFMRAADGTVLAEVAADRAVHPASVSKVAATLALLDRLGPAHRFVTRVAATGPLAGAVLDGDLVVEGGGDPFLVSEHALWMAAELRRQGVERVAGTLRVDGPLLFDWRADPDGRRLRAVLSGRAGAQAWPAARAALPALHGPVPALRFLDGPPRGRERRVLLEHRSPPLVKIVKALNAYSNNVFHPLSDAIGGPTVIEEIAKRAVPARVRAAIRLDNAAGAGTTNRLSPRAAVELTDALARLLERHGLALSDVLPVTGIDAGTLRERLDGDGLKGAIAGKTGTFGSVGASALAGVVRTRRWGVVTFAILNRGLAVADARARQDAFLRAFCADAGAEPFDYRADPTPIVASAALAAVD